jgi:hypothetical protein
MLRSFIAVVVFFTMITGTVSVQAEGNSDVSRVMVLPFDGTSSGNFSYLTDSIRAMVSSRLAAESSIEVVDYSLNAKEINQLTTGKDALAGGETIFSKYNTDYIVTGGLYALQTGLKIQISLFGKEVKEEQGTFSALAVNEGQILSTVEGLTQDVAIKGIGGQAKQLLAAAKAGEESTGLSGFSTEHPDKLFKKGVYGGSIVGEGGDAVQAIGVRRSSPIPTMLVSMATGDLDGDGKSEIAVVSRKSIEIYQFDETRFRKLVERDFSARHKIHAVNIADINGDGRPEIIVSANEGTRASSSILNWSEGKGLVAVMEGIDWYLRPLMKSGGEVILAGQKGSSEPSDGYVAGRVKKMILNASFTGLAAGESLSLPENMSLFDFIWADLDGNGLTELIAVDGRERLLVYDSGNNLIWVSDEDYGGSRNFFGPTRSNASTHGGLGGGDMETQFDRVTAYIPGRLVAVDLDGDGSEEIVVGKNKRRWSKWLAESREYDGGTVACLGWRDSAMKELWETNTLPGYVADYNVLMNGGRQVNGSEAVNLQLYVSQVPDSMMFGFLLDKESKMLRYELGVGRSK